MKIPRGGTPPFGSVSIIITLQNSPLHTTPSFCLGHWWRFLSGRIIRIIMKHTDTNGRSKADIFRTMIDSEFFAIFYYMEGSRRRLGSTRITRTICSQFWVQIMKNKPQFTEPQINTTTGCFEFIGEAGCLPIAAIVFSAGAFGHQTYSMHLVG